MSKVAFIKRSGQLLATLFLFVTTLQASFIIEGESNLDKRAAQKVKEMGSELFQKSGISVYLSVPTSLGDKKIVQYEQDKISSLQEPFALLTIATSEKQVNIVNSKALENSFDKEGILSPFPWTGTIIPILTGKKDNDNINAAVINGYADIVEQIAASKNIVLESAIGNANKKTINFFKVLIYGSIAFLFGIVFYKKVRKKNV